MWTSLAVEGVRKQASMTSKLQRVPWQERARIAGD
jgi:hypothetical protein